MLAPVAPGGAATPKVVGQVVAVGGTKRLQTRDVAGGPPHRLNATDDLVLGEQVVMGAGVTATLRVARPKGVSPDVDLIDLEPAAGTHHNVVVSREGADTIIKIRPAA